MPVDRKTEARSLRRDRREVAGVASHSNCDGLNAVLFAPSQQGLFHRAVFEFIPSFQHAARIRYAACLDHTRSISHQGLSVGWLARRGREMVQPNQRSTLESEMIDLYAMGSPNVVKVYIALEEMGLPYTVHPVDVFGEGQFKPEFLRLNLKCQSSPITTDRAARRTLCSNRERSFSTWPRRRVSSCQRTRSRGSIRSNG